MSEPPSGSFPARFARLPASSRGALLMIASAAGFAVMMAIVRHLSRELHPFEVAFFRNLFGLVAMLPWMLHVGRDSLATDRMGMHFIRSAAGLASMLTFFTALSLLPLAEVTALNFTTPMFTTIGAALILGEKVKASRWAATGVGFAGALIILRPGAETLHPASLVALAAAALMALAFLTIKSLSRTENPNAIVVMMGLLMTPMSLLPALFVWETPALQLWPWLLGLGFSASIGQVFLTRAFAAADASAVLPFDFSRLIFVSILGFFFFGECPDLWTWVGAGVIVAAAAYIAQRDAVLGAAAAAAAPH